MSMTSTVERIIANTDVANSIIPYAPKWREQVIAGALEMHRDSIFGAYRFDANKLISQIEIAEKFPDTMRFRLAVRGEFAYGAFYGHIQKMFFSDELMARDVGWWVRPEWRGSWAAILLLADFEEWAREKGCKKVMLGQSSGTQIDKTTRLYENCGYHLVGVNTVKDL